MPSGAVEVYRLLEVLEAASLLQRAPGSVWSDSQHSALLSWYEKFYNWYKSSDVGQKAKSAPNNVAIWYHAFMMSTAVHLNKKGDLGSIASGIKSTFQRQISSDGELPLEVGYVDYGLCRKSVG